MVLCLTFRRSLEGRCPTHLAKLAKPSDANSTDLLSRHSGKCRNDH